MGILDGIKKEINAHGPNHDCEPCKLKRVGLPPNVPVEEVEQYEPADFVPDYPCVPVDVKNIVNVRQLPAKRANMLTYALNGQGAANAQLVVGADPRIKRVYFTAGTNDVWIGTEAQIKAPNGPFGYHIAASANSPGFEGVDENLWAVAGTSTSTISTRVEYWAD